jgi:hypothetical protein
VFPGSCHHWRKKQTQKREVGESFISRGDCRILKRVASPKILDSVLWQTLMKKRITHELRGRSRNSRNELRFSMNRVPVSCPYMGFSDASWCQMYEGNSQLCKANGMEMSLH